MNGAWMASLPARADAAGLPAAWLRDNCRCAECVDPVTGDPGCPRDGQQAILDDGLILLDQVLTDPGTVLAVAGREQ
jgi:Gamma-butyrobetaine hydroxylase-like, N-terminal